MTTHGFYLNEEQEKRVSEKLDCRYDEIGKVVKASLNINKNSKWFRDFFKGAFSVEDMVRVYKNLEPIIKSYGPNDYNLIMNSVIIEGESDLESKIEAYVIKVGSPEFKK